MVPKTEGKGWEPEEVEEEEEQEKDHQGWDTALGAPHPRAVPSPWQEEEEHNED